MTRFVDEDGHATYFGTYTAFSGASVRQELPDGIVAVAGLPSKVAARTETISVVPLIAEVIRCLRSGGATHDLLPYD